MRERRRPNHRIYWISRPRQVQYYSRIRVFRSDLDTVFLTLSSVGDFPEPQSMGCTPPPLTRIENGIKRFLYKHISYPDFCVKIFQFLDQNFIFYKKFEPKSSFLNISSEMKSTHPFYPILIPKTIYVKFLFFFILFVGRFQGVPKI